MTSSGRRHRAQGWVAVTAAALLAAGAARAESAAPVDSLLESAPADSAVGPPLPPSPAWVDVATDPPGVRVWIAGLDAGLSPTGPIEVAPGTVVVRTFAGDPRRFDPTPDGAVVTTAPGETLVVRLDLRASVLLRSDPEPATIARLPRGPEGADRVEGATPLRLPPARLEGALLRFGARGYADTVVAGSALLAEALRGDGAATVALRSLRLPPPAPPRPPALWGRRWFQWGLVGLGAALTGGAALLREKGDRTYDRYLQETRPAEIERLYDRTIRYDRWGSVSLGVGQGALTAGILLMITGLGR